MNKNIENLALKIFEDEEMVKKILNTDDFDKLYDIIKSIEPQINKSEIEEFMKNFSKNNLSEVSQDDLEAISGGKSDMRYKTMASAMAMIMGLSPCLGAKPPAAEVSEEVENKPITQKVKDWVSGHKVLSAGSGVAFITAISLGTKHVLEKRKPQSQSREELLRNLPGLWKNFWNAYGAAYAAANNAAGGAANYAANNAAYAAANNAAGGAAYAAAFDDALAAAAGDAEWGVAWDAAWDSGGAAYNIITSDPETYNDEYLRNLTRVLTEQTNMLNELVQNSAPDPT